MHAALHVHEQDIDAILVGDLQRLTKGALVDVERDGRRPHRRVGNAAAHAAIDERTHESVSADSLDIVESALILARSLDAPALDETLRRSVAELGVSPFIETVAGPLLRRVGDEWHAGRLSPAPEHLVSSIVHDIVAGTMRAFPQRHGAPRVLVATPAGDRHAIGAALVGAVAAMEGWNVLYLGTDLPAHEIADAASAARVRVVALSVVYVDDAARVLDELRTLRSRLPAAVAIIAGGAGARSIAAELTSIGVLVEAGVPGLVTQLRRMNRASVRRAGAS